MYPGFGGTGAHKKLRELRQASLTSDAFTSAGVVYGS